ncbi:tail-specific protease precursor [Vibrio ishigakensis]|nr:tail-specific protease precursor [Vibrio ishigakensis]GAM75610.1 tail-specific protease precursor [Vibrio ishigakensis]
MKMRAKITLIAASVMLAASANAVEANLSLENLPTLTPEVQHQTSAKRVTSRFTRSHYKQFKLDDQFSEQIFDRYLNMLDYNRNLFTQAEVDGFEKWRTQLDDA